MSNSNCNIILIISILAPKEPQHISILVSKSSHEAAPSPILPSCMHPPF